MKIAPLALQVVDHVGVVHDLVAHVDRRAELASSARSTISIARSTPAQKPRGSASTTSSSTLSSLITARRSACTSKVTGWPASGWLKSNSSAVVARPRARRRHRLPCPSGVGNCTTSPTRVVARRRRRSASSSVRATRCSSSGLRSPKASPGGELERARARPPRGRAGALPSPATSSPVPSDSVAGLSSKVLMMSPPSGPARR